MVKSGNITKKIYVTNFFCLVQNKTVGKNSQQDCVAFLVYEGLMTGLGFCRSSSGKRGGPALMIAATCP